MALLIVTVYCDNKKEKIVEEEEVVEITSVSRMKAKIVSTNLYGNGHRPSSSKGFNNHSTWHGAP
jgi:hypothetical protein